MTDMDCVFCNEKAARGFVRQQTNLDVREALEAALAATFEEARQSTPRTTSGYDLLTHMKALATLFPPDLAEAYVSQIRRVQQGE